MAYPTIRVNSSTGNDILCSGAGPETSVYGTKACTPTTNPSDDPKIGFFDDTPPDLSGVLDDGSHVVLFADSNSGSRNFCQIRRVKTTNKSIIGSAFTGSKFLAVNDIVGFEIGDIISVAGAGAEGVTFYSYILSFIDNGGGEYEIELANSVLTTAENTQVVNPPQIWCEDSQIPRANLTNIQWAIGGKLASIGATLGATSRSRCLFYNGDELSAGDAMGGWTILMESGHQETISSDIYIIRSGSRITLKGENDAIQFPVLTAASHSVDLFEFHGARNWLFENMILLCNGSQTTANSFAIFAGNFNYFKNITIGNGTNDFNCGIRIGNSSRIESCCVYGAIATKSGILVEGSSTVCNCKVTGNGVGITCTGVSPMIFNNILYNNAAGNLAINITDTLGYEGLIMNNILHGSAAYGIQFYATMLQLSGYSGWVVANNCITNNGTGIIFQESTTISLLQNYGFLLTNNNFGSGDTANTIKITAARENISVNELNVDPQYADPDGSPPDFSVGNNLNSQGFPFTVIPGTLSRSYVDVGLQRVHDYPGKANTLTTDTTNGETGTATVPNESNVWHGTGTYGAGGTQLTPSKYGSSITNLTAANVKSTVDIDDATGTYEGTVIQEPGLGDSPRLGD